MWYRSFQNPWRTSLWGDGQKAETAEEAVAVASAMVAAAAMSKIPRWEPLGGGCVIPPGLPHDPTVCIIYGIKMTDSLGEIRRKKNNHKELKYFLYDRGILYRNSFNIIDWKLFEHMTTIVPRLFHIWVIKFVSVFCGTNYMRYKWKEVLEPVHPCYNRTYVKETALRQLNCPFLPRVLLFKGSVDSLHKWMKIKYTEPTMCAIICCYIRVKVQKLFQDAHTSQWKFLLQTNRRKTLGGII